MKDLRDIIIWEFFKETILPMSNSQIKSMQLQIEFFKIIRELLARRGNPVVNKQATDIKKRLLEQEVISHEKSN